MLSVVIPTLEEEESVGPLVRRLAEEVDEVVVSDGGSSDRTIEHARRAGARVVVGPPGRGPQLDRGVDSARGTVLWFVHADASVPPGLGAAVRRAAEVHRWGGCRVRIDATDPRLRWTALVMNRRALWTGSMTGDMGIWCHRELYREVGGFGTLPSLEDLSFTDRARAVEAWGMVGPALGTSARRWTRYGVTRTMAQMLALRAAYRLGVPPAVLAVGYGPARA